MSSENKPVMPPERIEETETEEEIRREEAAKGKGERAFEVFCAAIFLGMIGLVFFNAFLRYVFRSSFAPSEEWARFLFIYITFIGGIEAFYRHKHIAVDMFVNMISGASRKAVDIVASLFMLAALVLLLFGGISVALQTLDTYSVATDVNMAFINGTLPVMAFAAIIIHLRDIVRLIRTLKGQPFTVTDYAPFEYAVTTAGGVRCDEVNPYTMESLKVKGLYFAGEVLDIDANTGGYNLQIALSTGRLAGLLKK